MASARHLCQSFFGSANNARFEDEKQEVIRQSYSQFGYGSVSESSHNARPDLHAVNRCKTNSHSENRWPGTRRMGKSGRPRARPAWAQQCARIRRALEERSHVSPGGPCATKSAARVGGLSNAAPEAGAVRTCADNTCKYFICARFGVERYCCRFEALSCRP